MVCVSVYVAGCCCVANILHPHFQLGRYDTVQHRPSFSLFPLFCFRFIYVSTNTYSVPLSLDLFFSNAMWPHRRKVYNSFQSCSNCMRLQCACDGESTTTLAKLAVDCGMSHLLWPPLMHSIIALFFSFYLFKHYYHLQQVNSLLVHLCLCGDWSNRTIYLIQRSNVIFGPSTTRIHRPAIYANVYLLTNEANPCHTRYRCKECKLVSEKSTTRITSIPAKNDRMDGGGRGRSDRRK